MIRKINILTLILLFFVSTTGLPLSMHLCQMEENYSSHEECEINFEKSMQEMSCCEMEEPAGEIITSSDHLNCCEISVLETPIKDNFIAAKTEQKDEQIPFVIISSSIVDFSIDQTNNFKFYSSDSSPPLLIDSHIYLNNSSFLI